MTNRQPHSDVHAHQPHDQTASNLGESEPTFASESPSQDGVRLRFKVHGLDCAAEISALEREVGPLAGGADKLAFNLIRGEMTVLDSALPVSTNDVKKAVARAGLTAEEQGTASDNQGPENSHQRYRTLFTALSGIGVLKGIAFHFWHAGGVSEGFQLFSGHGGQAVPSLEIVAYALAIGFGVLFVLPKAWHAARRVRPDINLLMVIAVAGAIGIGEWFEGAAVAFLFSLSLTLEGWSIARARRAISALLDLAPTRVRVKQADASEKEIGAADVPVGALFIVKPGERIPLDGRIVSGTSSVDQAPITGESIPVAKEVDDGVFAGTINGDGALEVESTKRAEETTIARIIRMVEDAQGRRANAEQWVEKFARVYTPLVILASIAVLVIPPVVFGADWSEWLYRSLVLLVIACPCALVISTPVSIVSALAAAARNGVLVKGGVYIELPAHTKALAFDKTGTLTRGQPVVTNIIALHGHTEEAVLERAAALEARSQHPLARAVVNCAIERGIKVLPATDVQTIKGKGVNGVFDGEFFWLGSNRYLVERNQDIDEIQDRVDTLERAGNTVVAVGNDRHVCGLLAISDTLRPGARQSLDALRRAGIEHLVMLTGDNKLTAEAIALGLELDEIHAELLPEDKVSMIDELVERYETVAMIGDGVNDAPAMARASFGVAMGAAGSDAAIETADIALMTDDLTKLAWLVGHSRHTLSIIRQNIAFSLGVKALFVILTFAGFASLWGAIAADVGASLLVVANALRLLKARAETRTTVSVTSDGKPPSLRTASNSTSRSSG